MTMHTWEIVCLTLALLGVTAVAIYIFIRCFKSLSALNKESMNNAERPKRTFKSAYPKPDLDITQVYGVPYRSPTPVQPMPLDPSRLEAIVMQGKSDLHPKYLEYNDGLGDISARSVDNTIDQKVSWNGESVLLESEFAPSMTESPIVELHKTSSAVLSESPKMRKILHINYDRGEDGAPEIKNITTDFVANKDLESIENGSQDNDMIKNSTPKLSRSQIAACADVSNDHVAEVDHVTLQSTNERQLLKAPGGRWVEFDEDTPTVVIQDENGFIRQRLEFDA